jgi:DNA-binding SARP family transcriptional activator
MTEKGSQGMERQAPVLRVYLLGTFQVERADGTALTMESVFGRSHSEILFKLLLCHPERRVQRERLVETLWPGQSYSVMESSLGVAKSILKTRLDALCGQPVMPRVSGDPPAYSLAGQSVLWTDIDACEQVIRQAVHTPDTQEAFSLWEAAYALLQRGELLADAQQAYWYQASLVQDRRKRLARQRVQCVLRIADLSLELTDPSRAVTVLTSASEADPTNEEIAVHLMETLAQQGQSSEALRYYTRLEVALLEHDSEPGEETKALAQQLRSLGTRQGSGKRYYLPPAYTVTAEMISPELEYNMNRRELTQKAVRLAGAALFLPDGPIMADLLERFLRAVEQPSTIDERTLSYLEKLIERYWQDRHAATLASEYLLSYVLDHFKKVITFLESPLQPSVRNRLCSIASEIAQLAGHLLFDTGDFRKARAFHQVALVAAQEAEHTALQATAWARMSFTWTYSGNASEALHCIRASRHLAASSVNGTVRAYLAAVEAEIQAALGEPAACLKALDEAEQIEDQGQILEDSYWLRFDRSRLAGYQGSCYRRLYRPEETQAASFLTKGQQALTEALEQLAPTRVQRRPVLLIDLADIYTSQGDIEAACEYATQALTIIGQVKSYMALQRLLTLRQKLEQWQTASSVRRLDGQMASLLVPLQAQGER